MLPVNYPVMCLCAQILCQHHAHSCWTKRAWLPCLLPLLVLHLSFLHVVLSPLSEIWCFVACLCVSWHKHEMITTGATFPSCGVSHLKWRSYLLKPGFAIFVINFCNLSSPSPLCARMIVCNQVMKFILDRIDKDERQAAKRRKKEEVVEAKRRLANASKLSSLLYRHKESLKMEILKKRALLDKELQLEAQV